MHWQVVGQPVQWPIQSSIMCWQMALDQKWHGSVWSPLLLAKRVYITSMNSPRPQPQTDPLTCRASVHQKVQVTVSLRLSSFCNTEPCHFSVNLERFTLCKLASLGRQAGIAPSQAEQHHQASVSEAASVCLLLSTAAILAAVGKTWQRLAGWSTLAWYCCI